MSEVKKNNLQKVRHSFSHILAEAILSLYPDTKLGIGPAIDAGFYYDFDLKSPLSDDQLQKIEGQMKRIISEGRTFKKVYLTDTEAKKILKGQPYKLELMKELKGQKIVFYETLDSKGKRTFIDLCAGLHVSSTKELKEDAFNLTKLAGAYWKGDEKNSMLTRIYGVAFGTKKDLQEYLTQIEEAEKRDHRKIGNDLDLFSIDSGFGQGLILWHPKGAMLRRQIENFVLNEYLKDGYELVQTPHIANIELWKTSGHWGFYREGMYSPMQVDEEQYVIKPMNCPGHVKIYKTNLRSYKELPIRYTELGTVYRYERSGTLQGLTRVRGFTQDDAHIFCAPDQLESEIKKVIKLTKYILGSFNFKDFSVKLSVRDPKNKKKYLGDDKHWKLAEKALAQGIKDAGWDYELDEGEAVFYGPKMDIKVTDSIGREWQITTLQIDFNLPERFDVSYIDEKGKKQRPLMLHRALLGSLERFIGLLIEHYAGNFPLWLAPVQCKILSISDKSKKYAGKVQKLLMDNNIRVEIDNSKETLGKKIRAAEMQKIPYILVIGEKEADEEKVALRVHGSKKQEVLKLEDFVEKTKEVIEKRK